MLTIKGLIGALAAVAAGFSFPWMHAEVQPTEVRTVRWVLAHQPADVYENATRVFAEALSAETDGRLKMEILTPADVGFTGTGDISYQDTIKLLDEGKAELSTVYSASGTAADPALAVVNMPYLFKDYPNASRVFDGPVGSGMLDAYSAAATVRALSFTYSGGYRLVVSKKPLTTLNDLRGTKIAVSGGAPAESFWKSLGANPVRMDLESGAADLAGVAAVETTYTRLPEVLGTNAAFTRNILETNHSLFTTLLVVSDAFFDSLSAADQQALIRAARAATAVERQDSIALAERTRAEASGKGSSITTPSAEFQAKLMANAEAVYTHLPAGIPLELVSSIQEAQK